MNIYKSHRKPLIATTLIIFCLLSFVQAQDNDIKYNNVDWLAGPGGTIKGIYFHEEKSQNAEFNDLVQLFSLESFDSEILSNVIDSPPIAGFVPRIAVAVTDRHSDDLDFIAQPRSSIVGNYLTNKPETSYIMGLFDTGASTNIISNAGAIRSGIFTSGFLTPNTIEIAGATNSVFGLVSMPLAVFMDGLSAIDSETLFLDDSNMVGESNVSVVVGDFPEQNQPDLPTVIGSPVSVYYVTAIMNDNPISRVYDGNNYTSPDITFYEHGDPDIPVLANKIPLNLIPSGAADVQYFPSLDGIFNFVFTPGSPSVIGSLLQSLFFVSSVDLAEATHNSIDNDRFMLDTGAQVTVISSNIAARLGLNPDESDFDVEIQDVTGEITIEPGFYVDSLEIAALGQWLSFTNVPVVMLDVSSPEGGYLDGIIGMNLFTEYNMVLFGGGLLGQDPPLLTFERIQPRLIGDIAPDGGDGIVNYLDFAVLAQAWLATPESMNWNPQADIAPRDNPDSIIDFLDFAEMARELLLQ